ncbi:MAG: C25 family cysteine peptidase [Thermoanaerobaculia bacterium]
MDGFTVDYSRETRTADGRMDVTGTGEPLSVSGSPAMPSRCGTSTSRPADQHRGRRRQWTGTDYRATFGVSRVHYLVFEDGAQWLPQSWTPDAPSDLRTPAHSADYLIIAAPELLAAAQELADLRSAQGLESLVVSVQDVYIEFADSYRSRRRFATSSNTRLSTGRALRATWCSPVP